MATVVQGNAEGVPLTLETTDPDKNDTKKRRFLWGLRRMFRRRSARNEQEVREPVGTPGPPTSTRGRTTNNQQQQLTDDESPKRKRQQSGLSVSHDSVFTAEASGGDSDDERSRPRLRPSMAKGVPAELAAAVRRRARGDTSEEDEDLGLPRSPPASPPKRGPNRGRSGQTGAEQSSCSEGSLLSAGSSDPEDEFRSSKGDLTSNLPSTLLSVSAVPDSSENAEEPPIGLAPLSHSAARHKMAIRPRRTHGPPRHIKPNQMSSGPALPTTPEVNEDITRSTTPEVISSLHNNSTGTVITSMQQSYAVTSNSYQSITSSNVHYERSDQPTGMVPSIDELSMNQIPKETRMKSSSLPSGLALNQLVGQSGSSSIKLSLSSNEELGNSSRVGRSKSNAQKKDSSDSDDNLIPHEKQANDERIYSFNPLTKQGLYAYKSADMKHSNVLVGELHKKFGSVSEDEELAKSGNFEATKYEHKYRKNGEKRLEKSEMSENISQNVDHKLKYKESEETQEKHSNKKEESFFGRLLLRKSGKKTKKDNTVEKDDDYEDDKKQMRDPTPFKNSYSDPLTLNNPKYGTEHVLTRQPKMTCSDQSAHKSIGQKVFSNQNHKRMDPRGGYVNDPIIQESIHNYSKNSATEYGINEMKQFSDKSLPESQYSQSSLKVDDVNNKRLSSENILKNTSASQSRIRQRVEPLDIPVSPELQRKPPVLPRTSIESKSFFPIINQGKVYPSKEGSRYIKNVNSPSKIINTNDEFQYPHPVSPKVKMTSEAPNQNTGLSMDMSTKPLSYSVSPPRTVWPHNYMSTDMKSSSQGSLDHQLTRNSKTDYDNKYFDYSSQLNNDFDYDNSKSKPKIAGLSAYQQKISQIGIQLETDSDSPYLDSLNSKTSVTKSHSFRLNSDSPSSVMQQDMPSLPPMFGISESSIDSWETTYKKNLKENNDPPSSLELGSDSLMSYTYKTNTSTSNTVYSDRNIFIIPNIQSVQKDNLTNDVIDTSDQTSHFVKNVSHSKVRDTDISRIEANIDSIIGSPKPLNCVALKSNSLDSVKSFTEKSTDQNRKAISNESISQNKVYINQSIIPDVVGSVSFNPKMTTSLSKSENIESSAQTNNTSQNMKDQSVDNPGENHVSITVLNASESTISLKPPDVTCSNKSADGHNQPSVEKAGKQFTTTRDSKNFDKFSPSFDPSVPEFMKIQLNKVDQKPATNVVLSTSVSLDNKTLKVFTKPEKIPDINQDIKPKNVEIERSISYEPSKSEKLYTELKKSESHDKNISIETKEVTKPQRKFSSEDVEILEKSDISNHNNSISSFKKNSTLPFNKNNDIANIETIPQNNNVNKIVSESKPVIPTNLSIRKSTTVSSLPPVSPTAPKTFLRKKSETIDIDPLKRQSSATPTENVKSDNSSVEKCNSLTVTQNVKRISSQEILAEQAIRTDRSSSSSDDTNLESAVILRKKSMSLVNKNNKDDEPELMKVFARRSLKLKDSESEALSQDILNITNSEIKTDESDEMKRNSKNFNIMSRSRDSDKENEADSPKDERKRTSINSNDANADVSQNINSNKLNNKNFAENRKHSSETAELMQAQRMPKKIIDSNPVSSTNTSNFQPTRNVGAFGNYQRSVSASIPLSQTSYLKSENKPDFKKDISDTTPEKRLRNRTFPDSNNENREDNKTTDKTVEPVSYSIDTSSLPKRPWSQIKNDSDSTSAKDAALKVPFRKSSFITTDLKSQISSNKFDKSEPKDANEKSSEIIVTEAENEKTKNETDGSPQFKGIHQMRAEWELRAQRATTK